MGEKDEDKTVEGSTEDPPVSYFRLLSCADNLDRLLMLLGALGAIANGAAWPGFAIVFGMFSNSFGTDATSPNFLSDTRQLALYFLYIALGCLVASYFQAMCWMWTGDRQTNKIRSKYLSAVLRQEVAYFDTQATTGSLLQGLNEDCNNVQSATSEKVGHFLQHTSTFVIGWIVAFIYGWDMALVMFGCLPFLGAVGGIYSSLSTKMTAKAQEAYGRASDSSMQAISQIRTVQAYGREQKAYEEYEKHLEMPFQVGKTQSLANGISFGAAQGIFFVTYAVAFYYGSWRVTEGVYTGGQVLQVLISALLGGFSLGQAVPILATFTRGRTSATRIFKVIDRQPAIDAEGDGEEPEHVVGALELRDVKFAYPARPDVTVFCNFSLQIPAGKSVALVGSSGSGKSTVIQLIERFYDPAEGIVLLDGKNLRTLKPSWLRGQVGLVSQEPTLFATTIFQNILMGRPGASPQEVEAAAAAANAANFISLLPLGYDTHVGERGLQLSGGQKQRIAIARAILKNPKVLLLDEATSALDTASERIVQDALNRMIVGRTTVVVAHRLSTIKGADVIAVVQKGAVVEQGAHDELISNPIGVYSSLVRLQMNKETKKEEVEELEEEKMEVVRAVEVPTEGSGEDCMEVVITSEGQEVSQGQALEAKLRVSIDRPVSAKVQGEAPPPKRFFGLFGAKKAAAPADVPFSRLLEYNRPELPYAIIGYIGATGVGCVMPAFAFALSAMINALFLPTPDQIKSQAALLCGMFLVLAGSAWIVNILQQYGLGVMGVALARRIRLVLFKNIMRQEVGFFDLEDNSSGILSTRLTADAAYIRGAVGDNVGIIFSNAACLIFGYIVSFAYDWRMTLVVTGALPFMIIGSLIYYKSITGAESGTAKMYSQGNQTVTDAFGSIRVVIAYNLQQQIRNLFFDQISGASKAVYRQAHITGALMAYSQFTMFAVYGLIVFFGGYEVYSGRASFEAFLMAFLSVLLAIMGIAQAQVAFPDMGKGKDAIQRIFPLIDRQSKVDASILSGEKDMEVGGQIELKGITFIYPTRPSVVVLKNFDLLIPAQKQVALVGESGSGKSTVIGMIERFYEPAEGMVLIDGRDIKTLQLQWLRSQIALVSQEPLLFSTTLIENIRYGRLDATHEEVVQAAIAANAWEFINALPEGLETRVGEKGIQLSGGQKQRIAIARAVVRAPLIMLLDEATSALDASSESIVQEALDRVMHGRTSVVIAHRLSTVRNAHTIALVHRGSILEKGSHEELMALPDGAYSKLVAAQSMRTTTMHVSPSLQALPPVS